MRTNPEPVGNQFHRNQDSVVPGSHRSLKGCVGRNQSPEPIATILPRVWPIGQHDRRDNPEPRDEAV
jgi:hypothetical protein